MPRSGMRRRSSSSSIPPCRGPSATSFIHVSTSTSRSRSTCRPTSTRRPHRRGGAADRGVRGGPGPRRCHTPAGHRRDPGGDGAGSCARSTTWASIPRCSPTSVVDLVEAGAITGALKERNRGKLVTAFLMGTQRLYDFVDDNPMVEMRPVDFTNDTHVIRSFSRMIAINSALEVDLTGQVVADSLGHAAVQRRGRADGLHPRRRPGRGGSGDHRAAIDGRAAGRCRGSCPRSRKAPASSRPEHTSGRSSPSTASRSCSAGACANARRHSSGSRTRTIGAPCALPPGGSADPAAARLRRGRAVATVPCRMAPVDGPSVVRAPACGRPQGSFGSVGGPACRLR